MTRVNAPPELPTLLSVPELAAYLGVPVSTIHYWRAKQEGPPGFKVGKRICFRTDDVARWLAEKRVP
jgi:excisionase family DNA binding protein